MSKSIFISHAVKDKAIASSIVELIEEGIGVPEKEIFCSSLDGYGIPTGENFIKYIKDQIDYPVLVVLVLTPCYFQSHFCLSELGAAWVKAHKIFPILVPPLKYSDVKDVLLGTQTAIINEAIKYNEIKDYLEEKMALTATSATKWDTKRSSFIKKVDAELKNIEVPKQISEEAYSKIKSKLYEATEELDKYKNEVTRLKSLVISLEKTKDKIKVKKIKREHQKSALLEDFEEALIQVSNIKKHIEEPVFEYIISEYYKKPYTIDFQNDSSSFESAVRINVIEPEGEGVNWDNKRVKTLTQQLKNISSYIDDNDRSEELFEMYEEKYENPLELDNQEFWDQHY